MANVYSDYFYAKLKIVSALSVLFLSSHLSASSPEFPIRIENTDSPWQLRVNLDTEHFEDFYVQLSVQKNGTTISQNPPQSIPVQNNDSEKVSYPIPVGSVVGGYPDGLYSQVVRVGGKHVNADSNYVNQHFVYLQVKNGNVRRLSMRDYSELLNPVDYSVDSQGEVVRFHHGELQTNQAGSDALFEGRLAISGHVEGGQNDENEIGEK